jgi:hypothetical protein
VEPARSREQRKADALAMLATPAVDVWVASAGAGDDGTAEPWLVPVSLAWVDERAVIAVESTSRTARNLAAAGGGRLAVGPTRDVVMLDVLVERVVPVGADPGLDERYCAQADWDPREAGGGYVLVVLRPHRIQAWREANEIRGRTLMRDGRWLA